MSKQLKSIGKVTSFIINSIVGLYAIITLVISYYFYFFAPDGALSAFILSAYLLILIPTFIIALILVIIMRNKWLALLLLPNLLIIGVYLYPYFTPRPEATLTQGETIRVMTFNVQNQGNEAVRDTYAQLITQINPDIVAFQEFSDFAHFRWQENGQLPYPYIARGMVEGQSLAGQGVYTRYPILEEEVWIYEDLSPTHPHQRLLLDINGTAVALYNIHPYPPIEWEGELNFAVNEVDIFAHSEAMQRIIARIEAEIIPVLVVGDMNMSDQFPEYRQLANLLTDSFLAAGYGFGFTYPADSPLPPLMRLDYIFHSSEFQTLDAQVIVDTGTSDHLPVVADIVLSN